MERRRPRLSQLLSWQFFEKQNEALSSAILSVDWESANFADAQILGNDGYIYCVPSSATAVRSAGCVAAVYSCGAAGTGPLRVQDRSWLSRLSSTG